MITDYTLEEIVDAYSISEEELDIDCTFNKKEADFLVDKLASMDLNNYPFLAKKGKPMVISTGLSEIDKMQEIVILHCVSTYPPI
jgi:N-acetylneuraminate synthase